jgi:hypothetical protein
MPSPGDVLFHRDFQYQDGIRGEKLIIVLNQAELSTNCLALKTTSKDRRYLGALPGCNPEKKVFFIPKGHEQFHLDTYVQIPQIFPISTRSLISNGLNQLVKHEFSLSSDCFKQLLNCLKKHFKEDISEEHWEIIF